MACIESAEWDAFCCTVQCIVFNSVRAAAPRGWSWEFSKQNSWVFLGSVIPGICYWYYFHGFHDNRMFYSESSSLLFSVIWEFLRDLILRVCGRLQGQFSLWSRTAGPGTGRAGSSPWESWHALLVPELHAAGGPELSGLSMCFSLKGKWSHGLESKVQI